MKLGVLLWNQRTTWPSFRDAAVAADRAGVDSIWTWDHLMAIVGSWEQPILEGWSLLSGLAPLTDRASLGLLVGANTFRNPGLTAKHAATLDHQSEGRAVLGLGGAWFEREHDAYGIDFGSGFGERLDRLDEASERNRLLDERCAEVGRDPASIERTIAKSVVLRDDPAEARAVFEDGLRGHGVEDPSQSVGLTGSPAAVAAEVRPYAEIGFDHLIVALREPFDHQTIERLPELRAAIEGDDTT